VRLRKKRGENKHSSAKDYVIFEKHCSIFSSWLGPARKHSTLLHGFNSTFDYESYAQTTHWLRHAKRSTRARRWHGYSAARFAPHNRTTHRLATCTV